VAVAETITAVMLLQIQAAAATTLAILAANSGTLGASHFVVPFFIF